MHLSTMLTVIIRQFTVFPFRFDSPQLNGDLISSIINFTQTVHELPSDLRLRILQNKEMIAKSWNEVGTQATIAQSSFQKSIFGTSGQNIYQMRYEKVLVLSNFAIFFARYFFQEFRNTLVLQLALLKNLSPPSMFSYKCS